MSKPQLPCNVDLQRLLAEETELQHSDPAKAKQISDLCRRIIDKTISAAKRKADAQD